MGEPLGQLIQRLPGGGYLTLELRDDVLHVKQSRFGVDNCSAVPLMALAPHVLRFAHRRHSTASWGLLWSLFSAMVCFGLVRESLPNTLLGIATCVGLFLAATTVCLLPWWLLWHRTIALVEVGGGQILYLSPNYPTQHDVRRFLDTVLARARKHLNERRESTLWASEAYNVARELRASHDLLAAGAITQSQFEAKKTELLDKYLEA
jgi:hypothetical protein